MLLESSKIRQLMLIDSYITYQQKHYTIKKIIEILLNLKFENIFSVMYILVNWISVKLKFSLVL